MYRDIIEGRDLAELLPDLPEEFRNKTLEIYIRVQEEEEKALESFLQRIKRRVQRGAYLGKEQEVFFFEGEELPQDWRRPLIGKLKELGYQAEAKEGARGTVVLTVSWVNA